MTNILSFEKQFPGAKVIKLEQNYRSTTPIISLANDVIKKNSERMEKNLFSTTPSEEKTSLWPWETPITKVKSLLEDIVQHQANGGHLGDIAILYRSKTQAPPLEEQLRLSDVPYTIIGGQKFFDKKEIKDLIAYLCTIHNTSDEISLRRIINIPHRGIGSATLKNLLNSENKKTLLYFKQ